MKKTNKFYLQTFGCQMNKNDSERIVGLLLSLGLKQTKKVSKADILLVNTCSVRQAAEDRIFGVIFNWQVLKEKNPDLIIGVTGCMPGRDKDKKIRKKLSGVDLFFSIDELIQLPKWLNELNPKLFTRKVDELSDYLVINPKRAENYRAYIAIQTGCNNFCTYCVVPYSRGRERNRPVKDILKEVEVAVENGAQEVVLLGQVVNNYHAPDRKQFSSKNIFVGKDDFAALLWEVNQVKNLKRIHFTAADPQYFNDYQIQALILPKQVNFLHLPVQSGNNEILKKMNRHYTREQFLELVKKINKMRPGIALGTDIIVGFCGETEAQFADTLDLYKQARFDISYHAKYSERTGTVAAKAFCDDVPLTIKKKRWQAVQDLMEEITWKKNQKYLNKPISVLVEKFYDGVCSGFTSEMKYAEFLGEADLVGKVINLKTTETDTWRLKGKRVE